MRTELAILLTVVCLASGCAGALHYTNTKGVDAKAKASDIETGKAKIEDAKGKADFSSTVDLWIHWPWKMKWQKK
ncbi:MAG: hypothetical protein NG712_05750 [Omnitrophica bacterium]|nr:hypothetical protein [Candidatus Omnitrophota bacterium]